MRRTVQRGYSSLVLLAAFAVAAPRSARADAIPAAASQSPSAREARQHFANGVAAFEALRLKDAADEFEKAYQISPAFQVLFNIAQVDVALGRHVEAVRAFQAYLDRGGRDIAASRRAEVQVALERQRDFVGTLAAQVSPEGAEILVDGVAVGSSPLREPMLVSIGSHRLQVALSGYRPEMRQIEVPPRSEVHVEVTLEPERALAAPSPIPAEPPPTPQPASPAPPSALSPDDHAARTTGPRAAENEPRARIVAAYVSAGAGISLLATGIYLALDGASVANAALAEARRPDATGASWDAAQADYDGARLRNRLGLGAVAIGTAAAGVAIYLFAAKRSDSPTSVSLALTPAASSGASQLSVRGSW